MELRGVEGLSVDEVRMRVNQGGRFVVFTWTLSFIVMTIRRPTAVTFINPGESAALKGLPFTLISLVFGWWGIPWGFIYTPMSIFENLGGGKDVTREVIATLCAGAWQSPQVDAAGGGAGVGGAPVDPGSAFRNEPGTMRPAPRLSDQLGVENDAKASLYLGLASLLCFPSGWVSFFFGGRAVSRARSLGLSVPGTAVAGLVLASCTTLCFTLGVVGAVLAPKKAPPAELRAGSDPGPGEALDDRAVPLDEDEAIVQPRLGDGEPARLGFRIAKRYERHKPAAKPPYHEPGGDWTFMDLEAGEGVALTAGVQVKVSAGPVSFGKVQLSVPSRAAGEAFLSAFNAKFGGAVPDKTKPHQGPLLLTLAVLGTGMVRDEGGGFTGGKHGRWTATKLFPELDEQYGEVFFNYSLEDETAELSEKDPEYADALAYVFAAAFAGR